MNTTWTTLRSRSSRDLLGPILFRTNGEKTQRRTLAVVGSNYGSTPLKDYLEKINALSAGLEDVSIDHYNDYDYSRTLVVGWSDDMDGYTEDDLTSL